MVMHSSVLVTFDGNCILMHLIRYPHRMHCFIMLLCVVHVPVTFRRHLVRNVHMMHPNDDLCVMHVSVMHEEALFQIPGQQSNNSFWDHHYFTI